MSIYTFFFQITTWKYVNNWIYHQPQQCQKPKHIHTLQSEITQERGCMGDCIEFVWGVCRERAGACNSVQGHVGVCRGL